MTLWLWQCRHYCKRQCKIPQKYLRNSTLIYQSCPITPPLTTSLTDTRTQLLKVTQDHKRSRIRDLAPTAQIGFLTNRLILKRREPTVEEYGVSARSVVTMENGFAPILLQLIDLLPSLTESMHAMRMDTSQSKGEQQKEDIVGLLLVNTTSCALGHLNLV